MNELSVDAALENIEDVTAFADAQLELLDCPVKAQTQFNIAIDEIISNIARYAYAPEVGKVTVRISLSENPPAIAISFIDSGVPFDPLKRAAPNTAQPVEDRSAGGLGILLVKKLMDKVVYERSNGNNILTISKNI